MLRTRKFIWLAFLPGLAFGQERDSTEKLLPIEEVVVTGQFRPTSLKNSVYKVRTLDQQYIQRRATTDMATLLNMELGIRFNNDLTLGESDIQLMGVSGQNVKVLIDGVPMIDRGSTKQSLSQIDINTIERIEIVEGPVSVMYGTDALAGVINIITQPTSTRKNKWGVTARVLEETVSSEYIPLTSEGRHNAHVGLSYLQDNWSFNWSGSRNNFGGFQGQSSGRALDWQPKDQWLTGGRIGYQTKKFNATYNINYANEDIYTPGAIGANYKYIDKNYLTDRLTQVLQSQWNVNDRFQINGSFSLQNYRRESVTRLFDLQTESSFLTTGEGEQDVSKFNQAFVRLNGVYQFNDELSLLAGLEFDQDKGSGARITAGADIYDMAAFLSAEYRPLSWILLRPGLRFIHNSIYNAPPAIPSFNAKLVFDQHWDLRMGYAMGFRAPGLRELYFTFHDSNHAIEGNTDLKAEHNHNFNASVNFHSRLGDRAYISSTLGSYYNHFINLITVGQHWDNPTVSTYLNIGKYKTIGATWENAVGYGNWTGRLGLGMIGRYNDLYSEHPGLGEFFWTPEANATLTRDFPKWDAHVNAYYKLYGKRPNFRITGSNDNMEVSEGFQQAYHQLDVSVGKRFFGALTLQLGVRNLTNTTNILNTTTEDTGAHAVNSTSIPVAYGRSAFFGLIYQY